MTHEELIQLAPDDPRRCAAVLAYMRAGRSCGMGKFEWDTIEAVLEARCFHSDTGSVATSERLEKAEALIRQASPSRSILTEEGATDWQARRFEWLSDSADGDKT